MPQIRVGQYNADTGETLEGSLVYMPNRKSAFTAMYGNGRFFVMSQEAFFRLAQDKDLTLEPIRVFHYLCSKIDFENYIRVPQKEIAETLGMRKSHVSEAMKLLEVKGVILKGERSIDRSFTYRLNPSYGYKGDPRKVIQGHFGQQKKHGFDVIQGGKPEPSAAEISEMRKLEAAGQQRLFE